MSLSRRAPKLWTPRRLPSTACRVHLLILGIHWLSCISTCQGSLHGFVVSREAEGTSEYPVFSRRPQHELLDPGRALIQHPQTNASSTYSLQTLRNSGNPTIRSHVACPAASQNTSSSQCQYVKEHEACWSDSLLDYGTFYFCSCLGFRTLGFLILLIWLASLFFMLGNTAADYFCPALEELSTILHLPPTVAGVTLLPLGNGAPDVFASVASFMGAQQGEVGLNSVLGAASFVTCVVAGSVCIAVARRPGTFKMDKQSFLRDIGFFIFTVLVLLVIVVSGKLSLWGALAFFALYAVYGASVAYFEMAKHKVQEQRAVMPAGSVPLQPLLSGGVLQPSVALLPSAADAAETPTAYNLPQWMWIRSLKTYQTRLAHPHMPRSLSAHQFSDRDRGDSSYTLERSSGSSGHSMPRLNPRNSSLTSVYSPSVLSAGGDNNLRAPSFGMSLSQSLDHIREENEADLAIPQYDSQRTAEDVDGEDEQEEVDERLMWGWEDEEDEPVLWYTPSGIVEYFIKLPLTFPRMLTIPVHSKDSWSRTWFTISVTISPVFASLVIFELPQSPLWMFAVASTGVVLGLTAYLTSTETTPPKYFTIFWVACGFSMSILWFYLIANELVALLVTFGIIMEIDSAVLGLTVLAWGNSIGDFMANLALVQSGGSSRVQIAWSGCFAGPLFNILVGLGISMVISTWSSYPKAFALPHDPALPWLLAFILCVLVFVIIRLPAKGMKLDRLLGLALIGSYSLFITLRLLQIFGFDAFSFT